MLICGAESAEERKKRIVASFGLAHLPPEELKLQLTETKLAFAWQTKKISREDWYFMMGLKVPLYTVTQDLHPVQNDNLLLRNRDNQSSAPQLLKKEKTAPLLYRKPAQAKVSTVNAPTTVIAQSEPVRNKIRVVSPDGLLQYIYGEQVFATLSLIERSEAPEDMTKDIGMMLYVFDSSPQQNKCEQIISGLKVQFPKLVIDENPLIVRTPAMPLRVPFLGKKLQLTPEKVLLLSREIPHLFQDTGNGKYLLTVLDEEHLEFEQNSLQHSSIPEELHLSRFFDLLKTIETQINSGQIWLGDEYLERVGYQLHEPAVEDDTYSPSQLAEALLRIVID